FFFSSRRRHTRFSRDWSSDVCSSDLVGYALAGVLCCLLIVTIPFGVASFRMASYALWPFGRTLVRKPGAGTGSTIGNIIWIIVRSEERRVGKECRDLGMSVLATCRTH